MVACRGCGASWGAADRFCGDCGAPLEGCPACGAPTVPGRRFCSACGCALADAPAAVAGGTAAQPTGQTAGRPGAPVAERRVCSVLFCDLVGFTPLSQSRDPEAVRELLSAYFAAARMVIERYGGVVEKFIGDAVMAVWGTPVATEGDGERAVRAALDLVAAVAQLGSENDASGLAARAGVVTGEVAVTLGAVGEGMVAGDAVNTAARVQAAAGAGQVLADEPTVRLATGAVGFVDAGAHALKGKPAPVPLWRATRVLAGVGGSQRIDGLEAPLAGRDAELRTLKELFHAAVERRMPRLVLVRGPAGVGKSRLGWEFEKYADGLAGEVWWHRGRCLSYGDGVAFWALAEIVRQRMGIAEEDPPDVAAAKLAAGVAQFIPEPERDYVSVRLGRLLGVSGGHDSGAALSRDELFAGWRLLFERLSAQRPVVLLVEDAQHADAGVLDFLDHLVDWVRELPVYVVVFARPEPELVRSGFGVGRNRTTLTLDPLDPASMDALVDALVPGMPPAARAKVVRHAQGIPLFAVETVRSLIDRDIVRPSEGVYRLVGDVGELQVPDSLHALLAARLDALEPLVRRLAADAAVLGTTFPAEALVAVSGQDEAAVRAGLADLLHREVLTVSADPLSPERGNYGFAQQMLRQVAYDTLSHRDRKARHLAVARHLRQAFPGDGEEVVDVIAGHYLDALNAIPADPDTGQIREQAVAALVRAAERAGRTGAPARAAASYAAAADLTEAASEERQAAALWEKAAAAAVAGADYPAAVEHAGRARRQYLDSAQPRAAARAQVFAGEALRQEGRHGEARQQFAAALAVLRAEPDTDTVSALRQLALLEFFAGSPEADGVSAEALTLGQAVGVGEDELERLLLVRGLYHAASGRRAQAMAYLRESARLAAQTGDNVYLGRVLLNLSDVLSVTDPAAAAECARTAAGHLRRAGAPDHLAFATANLTQALMMLGDWDAAAAELDRAVDGGLSDRAVVLYQRALLSALRGDTTAADDDLRAALDVVRASEDPQDKAMVGAGQAFRAAARGQTTEALRHARDTLSHAAALGISHECLRWAWPLAARTAAELGDTTAADELLGLLDSQPAGHLAPMLRAERDLTRARLAARDGDPDATAAFAAAITGLRELSTPYHLGHGLLDHAEHLLQAGEAAAAGLAAAEARDIAAGLRCQPLLDRAAALAPAGATTRAGP